MTGVTGLGAVVDCRAAADRAAAAYPALIRRVVAIAAIGTMAGIAVPALVAADGSSNTQENMARRKKPHWLPEIQWVVLRKHFIVFDETLHRHAFGIAEGRDAEIAAEERVTAVMLTPSCCTG